MRKARGTRSSIVRHKQRERSARAAVDRTVLGAWPAAANHDELELVTRHLHPDMERNPLQAASEMERARRLLLTILEPQGH